MLVFAAPMMEPQLSSKATASLMRKLASRILATTRVPIIKHKNTRSVTTDVSCVKTELTYVRCVRLKRLDTWGNIV